MNADAPVRRSRGRPKVEGLADQRRTQIIEAAYRVLTERGYDSTSIAEIAQEAGIGQGTVYRYVSSKRELLDHVFDWAVERLFHAVDPYAMLETQPTSAKELVGRFQVIGDRLYDLIDDDPAMLRLIGVQASAIDKDLKARVVGLEAMMNAVVLHSLAKAVESGWLVLSPTQKPVVARMLMMMSLPGVVMSLRRGMDVDKRVRYVGGATEIAFHGILKQ
jgi:AcrR family transcriptional regulator